MIKTCQQCGKEYKGRNISFCSNKCKCNSFVGKEFTLETRRKMSESAKKHPSNRIGCKHSEETKNIIAEKTSEIMKGNKYRLGKVHSVEWRRKLSEKTKGENSPTWRGGITSINRRLRNSVEWRLWREAVFARDNWTCRDCGRRGVELHPHHVKQFAYYPELRFAIDNGLTLCKKCHIKPGRHHS